MKVCRTKHMELMEARLAACITTLIADRQQEITLLVVNSVKFHLTSLKGNVNSLYCSSVSISKVNSINTL